MPDARGCAEWAGAIERAKETMKHLVFVFLIAMSGVAARAQESSGCAAGCQCISEGFKCDMACWWWEGSVCKAQELLCNWQCLVCAPAPEPVMPYQLTRDFTPILKTSRQCFRQWIAGSLTLT